MLKIVLKLVFVGALAAALSGATPASAISKERTPPWIRTVLPLIVDETLPGFVAPATPFTAPVGGIRIVVFNPPSASSVHGLGISLGSAEASAEAVKPGNTTELNIGLPAGAYNVFDAHGSNRLNGYSLTLNVAGAPAQIKRPGRSCGPFFDGFGLYLEDVRVKRTTCRMAESVSKKAFSAWKRTDFRADKVVARGYDCAVELNSPIGLRVICRRGNRQIRFSA